MTTVTELRKLAREAGLVGYSCANKARLIAMLEEHSRATEGKVVVSKDEEGNEVEKVEVAPVKKTRNIKPSPWRDFLKQYCAENKCSYKQAMSKKEEYAVYKANLQSQKEKESKEEESKEEDKGKKE